jgi:hypothetical protein
MNIGGVQFVLAIKTTTIDAALKLTPLSSFCVTFQSPSACRHASTCPAGHQGEP